MQGQSLALRLGALAAGGSLIALLLAGAVMATLQRAGAERAFDERLAVFVTQLFADYANNDVFDATAHFANPAFGLPGSGWYWAIANPQTGEPLFASTSLFDPLPAPQVGDGLQSRAVQLNDQRLRLIDRLFVFEGDSVLIRVSAPVAGLEQQIRGFQFALVVTLGAMWIALLVLAYVQVRVGLRPLQTLQSAVADVRMAKSAEVVGRFPREVSPLVDELNALLQANEAIIERARHHVGNLAHALKTPLAVILNSARGNVDQATVRKIANQAQSIDERVRLYLDRAQRAATQAGLGKATALKSIVDPLVRTMAKLNLDQGLNFQVTIDHSLRIKADEQDLEEMLGNLLENACRYASSQVEITAEQTEANPPRITIRVDDDGDGLSENARKLVLQRGKRLDETLPGSGLGLSIVNEMTELYGGSFLLSVSPKGGLRAEITLPAAAPVPPNS